MNVLVILGHKSRDSFGSALAHSYAEGARAAGANVQEMALTDLCFDPIADPRTVKELEPDLLAAQAAIHSADHVVWFYPVWWGSSPALLKAFIDRTFLPGFAYNYGVKPNGLPLRLLKGRTSRIVVTMDSPRWWSQIVYRNSAVNWLRWATLWFSGFRVVGVNQLCGVRHSAPEQRAQWLRHVADRAAQDVRKLTRHPATSVVAG